MYFKLLFFVIWELTQTQHCYLQVIQWNLYQADTLGTLTSVCLMPGVCSKQVLTSCAIIIYQKFMVVIHLSLLTMTSTVLILAVCRMPVTYELSSMTLFSMSSGSSVDRVPALCLGGYGFDSCQRLTDFFFVPCSCHVNQFTFWISLLSSKFTILNHLFTYQ